MTGMRFRPNSIERMLRQQKTRTIGVLAPSLLNPVFAVAIGGIQEIARGQGDAVVSHLIPTLTAHRARTSSGTQRGPSSRQNKRTHPARDSRRGLGMVCTFERCAKEWNKIVRFLRSPLKWGRSFGYP
ncbi:MAG: LacI family transcriptional regulator [Desulfovibrionales bacterium]|nr:MAG: LacI family transcriptional regulator [Desulfovibrionales bacterium]